MLKLINYIIMPFSINANGESDKGLGISATILGLMLEYFMLKLITSVFCYGFNKPILWLYEDCIYFILVVIFIIVCSILISKRYEISGIKIFQGVVLWPWTLVRAPWLIKNAEIKRRMKIIEDVMES